MPGTTSFVHAGCSAHARTLTRAHAHTRTPHTRCTRVRLQWGVARAALQPHSPGPPVPPGATTGFLGPHPTHLVLVTCGARLQAGELRRRRRRRSPCVVRREYCAPRARQHTHTAPVPAPACAHHTAQQLRNRLQGLHSAAARPRAWRLPADRISRVSLAESRSQSKNGSIDGAGARRQFCMHPRKSGRIP